MDLESYLAKTAKEVDAEMLRLLPKKITPAWLSSLLGKTEFAYDVSSCQDVIADPIWDFLSRGGKRWRPALTLLVCESLGGKRADALPFSVIPEFVHNGTIMVDDVQDNSSLRRGKPSTHLLFGVDVAINTGNLMYYLPLVLLSDNSKKLSAEKKAKIYALYSNEMLRLSFGQAMDIYWHKGNGSVTEKTYLQMTSFKTGSLARVAAGLGAILADSTDKQLSAILDFATSIGVAFQIQDDILNIKPEDANWGKEVGDDIHEGKRTLMVIHALLVLPKKDSEKLIKILDQEKKSDSDVKEAISLLESSGSINFASSEAKKIVSNGWKGVDKQFPDSDAKLMLKKFADYIVEREI